MLWWLVGLIAAMPVVYAAWTYNRLVGLGRRADGAWSDIDVQLKRRWDLVPALVEAVKGYTKHESGTLEQVVEARGRATAAASGPLAERSTSERSLATAVGGVFALAEAYPDLKANVNFLGLQKSLTEIEDNVQYARRYYNAVVRDFNTLTETVPAVLVAGPTGFHAREFFQLDDASQRAAPQVKL